MLRIEAAALAAMREHAEEGFPEEICGVVFASPAGQIVRRMTNIQNRLYAADPAANPCDARTAYQPDERELLEVNKAGEQPGWRILLFYHSHPNHGAYFSATDKAQALWGGPDDMAEPAYPGVAYLVISVYDGTVRDVKAYAWDEAARDFLEIPFAGGA